MKKALLLLFFIVNILFSNTFEKLDEETLENNVIKFFKDEKTKQIFKKCYNDLNVNNNYRISEECSLFQFPMKNENNEIVSIGNANPRKLLNLQKTEQTEKIKNSDKIIVKEKETNNKLNLEFYYKNKNLVLTFILLLLFTLLVFILIRKKNNQLKYFSKIFDGDFNIKNILHFKDNSENSEKIKNNFYRNHEASFDQKIKEKYNKNIFNDKEEVIEAEIEEKKEEENISDNLKNNNKDNSEDENILSNINLFFKEERKEINGFIK